ncbi:hypothetical protein N0V82_000517 [Gnomoniopsis sp. IMI 355080]|nr:hypothetical protein N0V82_000517 [Gnomoniopsis sp. IMI 355080]
MASDNSNQKRVYFHVEGDNSSGAGVQGWVRNKNDGNVEGEAQGGEREMAKFLKDIEKGPRGASVKQVDQEDREVANGEAAFEVRH